MGRDVGGLNTLGVCLKRASEVETSALGQGHLFESWAFEFGCRVAQWCSIGSPDEAGAWYMLLVRKVSYRQESCISSASSVRQAPGASPCLNSRRQLVYIPIFMFLVLLTALARETVKRGVSIKCPRRTFEDVVRPSSVCVDDVGDPSFGGHLFVLGDAVLGGRFRPCLFRSPRSFVVTTPFFAPVWLVDVVRCCCLPLVVYAVFFYFFA